MGYHTNLVVLHPCVFLGANAQLFRVIQAALPVGGGMHIGKVVMMILMIMLMEPVIQQAAGDHRCSVAGIGAGLIQSHRIKGSKHAHIGDDGSVVLAMAIAIGRNLVDDADMEAGASIHHGLGILGHLAVQIVQSAAVGVGNGVIVAGADAAAAAHAVIVIDMGLVVLIKCNGVVGAVFGAGMAATAPFRPSAMITWQPVEKGV